MLGLAKVKGTVKILLDLDRVLGSDGQLELRSRSGRGVHFMAAAHPESPELSDRDLAAIVRLVYEKSGITLHAGKRALVTARLQKRLQAGRLRRLQGVRPAACRPIRPATKLTAMLDAIATNHTSFFREPQHFEFLANVVLPPLAARRRRADSRLERRLLDRRGAVHDRDDGARAARRRRRPPRAAARVGSVDARRSRARRPAIYKADRVAELPRHLVLKYFEKGSGAQQGSVRVAAPVRQLIEFRQLNLLAGAAAGTAVRLHLLPQRHDLFRSRRCSSA